MKRGEPIPDLLLPDASVTEEVGRCLAGLLEGGDLVLLYGPLGAGKTTLVRGLVAGLGGDPDQVSSPTFVLVSQYEVNRGDIQWLYHADLYRLRGRPRAPSEELGLDEAIDDPTAVTAVEWPRGWSWRAGRGNIITVSLEFVGEQRRLSLTW